MSEEQPADMLARLGSDGFLWAQEFNKTAVRLGYSEMDEGWLTGWFANAIENSCNPFRNECYRLREENARLREAIERVLVGGNHVTLLIGADHPPDTATHDTAIKHYGSRHDEYEAWCCWKAIRAAAAAIREGGKDGGYS